VLKRGDRMMGSREVKAFLHRPKEELYDLTADPNELKNLLAGPNGIEDRDTRQMYAAMKDSLDAWREKTNDAWLIKNRHE
jgi:N-sulfoglucosamine sulfohydrolase